METKRGKNEIRLFPNHFKKVGALLILLAFIAAPIPRLFHLNLTQAKQDVFKLMAFNCIILGLFLIAWAKDKIEDEMTLLIRLKAVSWAFGLAVMLVIINPLMDLVFNDPIIVMKGQELIIQMLLVYLVMYHLFKKGR